MALEYLFDGYLLRVEDGVIERFSRAIAGSYRIPLAWASAEFEQRKHDVVRVQIGMTTDPEAPFFSSPAFTNPAFTLEVPSSEEPRLREFLLTAARTRVEAPRATSRTSPLGWHGLRFARKRSSAITM